MKYETAKFVFERQLLAIDQLEESLIDVQASEPHDIYVAYRTGVAHAMAELMLGVLNPLCRQHRSLMPEGADLGKEYLSGHDDSGL